MRALADGKAVSVNSFKEMTTAAPVQAGFTPPYGFGVSLLPLLGQRTVWHTGVVSGYVALVAYFPDQDVIISAATNARHVWLHQIVKDVAGEILGLQAPRLRDLQIDQREAQRMVGNYDDGLFKFRIFKSGARLFLDVPAFGGPMRLIHQGAGEFSTSRPTDFRVRFEPAVGEVERVVWEWAELRAYGRRVQR